jgi:hypothetical protein
MFLASSQPKVEVVKDFSVVGVLYQCDLFPVIARRRRGNLVFYVFPYCYSEIASSLRSSQ